MAKLEIACFNLESAITAAQAGADRIELCENRELGGITPSVEVFSALKVQLEIPIYVMIRPRGGNFCYSDAELEKMKNDLLCFKKLGASGFVFGILTGKGEVDLVENKTLVELAHPLPCTFHKAFDELVDQETGLNTCISCGFENILTSGGKATAREGLPNLLALKQRANKHINILPGGGIRSTNIIEINTLLQANCYHSAGIEEGEIASFNEIQKLKQQIV
jgi:copper homeostasis protein